MKKIFDIFIIGGGVNGCGIARDASGRGFSVCLAEMNDFAGGTSSWSTKLIHGGLRYLENLEFNLVRQSLIERENLLKIAPHIITPLKFILPHNNKIRNSWIIKLGLKVYDNLYLKNSLPRSKAVKLEKNNFDYLKDQFSLGFEYTDCWVDDARLVIFNARDAHLNGAKMMNYSKVIAVRKTSKFWEIDVEKNKNGKKKLITVFAKIIVNASGPWINETFNNLFTNFKTKRLARLIKGSHIVVPKIYSDNQAFIFQNSDKRVIFVIPFYKDFSLVGTTDIEYTGNPSLAKIDDNEKDYLCNSVSQYFNKLILEKDIVWTYSGVRSLYNDDNKLAQKVSRDYVIESHSQNNQTIINVFGGKLTTYRTLAEKVMLKIEKLLNKEKNPWTNKKHLPGGGFSFKEKNNILKYYFEKYSFLNNDVVERLFFSYGSEIDTIFKGITNKNNLGKDFGHGLFELEVKWMKDNEWAKNAEDVLWRRSKLGLYLSSSEVNKLKSWMSRKA